VSAASAGLPAAAPAVGVAALQRAAFAGMFLFGIAAALLGATLPLLSERLAFGLGRVGTLFLVMNAGMLASSFVLGALQDRFGMKPPLVAGPLGVGAALALVATASSYSQLLAAVLLLGVAGAALNGASNALVADLHEEPAAKTAALNRVGVFFGIVTLPTAIAFGVWVLLFVVSRRVSVGSIGAALLYPLLLRWFTPEGPYRAVVMIVGSAVALLVVIRHLPNIQRLLQGKEPPLFGSGAKEAKR